LITFRWRRFWWIIFTYFNLFLSIFECLNFISIILFFTLLWIFRWTWIWIWILLGQPDFSFLFAFFDCFFKGIYFFLLNIFIKILKGYNWWSCFQCSLFFLIVLFIFILTLFSCTTYSIYIHKEFIYWIYLLSWLFFYLLFFKFFHLFL